METTQLNQEKILIEIRKFESRPIYFKTGFLGGKMVKEVVILNPEDKKKWLCIDATDLHKLPTENWCSRILSSSYSRKYSRIIVDLPRNIDPGVTVWKGYVGKGRFIPILDLFEIDMEEKPEVYPIRKVINYAGNI